MAEHIRNGQGGAMAGAQQGARDGREGTAHPGGARHTNRSLASGELPAHDLRAPRPGVQNVANAGRRERQLAGSAGEQRGREFGSNRKELFAPDRDSIVEPVDDVEPSFRMRPSHAGYPSADGWVRTSELPKE